MGPSRASNRPRRDPIALLRRALRAGDGELALALAEALRRDSLLRPRTDEVLMSLTRAPAPAAGGLDAALVALGEALGRRGAAP